MRASRLAVLLALVPAAALAQAAAAGATEEAPGLDLGAPADAAPGGEVVAQAPAAAAPRAVPDAYTVKPGDTLWDLSGRFLNNPWYWPKIWSYNPEITNPHWISPGNTLRFFAGGDEAPARVAPVGDVAEGAPQGDEAPPRELADFSRADLKKPQEFGEGDEVAVVGPYKIGRAGGRGVYTRRDSFVTRRELEESGVLSAAFDEKTYLSIHDRAYARFAKAAPARLGERYTIYRTDRVVTHPVTQQVFGWKSTIIGAARVVAMDDKAVTIAIVAAYEPIERGAYLGPWAEKVVKRVEPRPNAREVRGYIIAAEQDILTELGEHHLVFIDKGRDDGVEEGNVFAVTRSGDPTETVPNAILHDESLPTEDVGSLLVIDTQANASSAIVVRSMRELYVGDHVEMRKPRAVASARLP
jgi:LysM domain-containing protein